MLVKCNANASVPTNNYYFNYNSKRPKKTYCLASSFEPEWSTENRIPYWNGVEMCWFGAAKNLLVNDNANYAYERTLANTFIRSIVQIGCVSLCSEWESMTENANSKGNAFIRSIENFNCDHMNTLEGIIVSSGSVSVLARSQRWQLRHTFIVYSQSMLVWWKEYANFCMRRWAAAHLLLLFNSMNG